MSYDVYLQDHNAEPWCSYGQDVTNACPAPCYPSVEVDPFVDGGTYAIGGTTEAELNITYNYSSWFCEYLDAGQGLRWLDGKTGKEALPRLVNAVDQLGTKRDADYWASTRGNAGASLARLAAWAKQYPNAIFKVI